MPSNILPHVNYYLLKINLIKIFEKITVKINLKNNGQNIFEITVKI